MVKYMGEEKEPLGSEGINFHILKKYTNYCEHHKQRWKNASELEWKKNKQLFSSKLYNIKIW